MLCSLFLPSCFFALFPEASKWETLLGFGCCLLRGEFICVPYHIGFDKEKHAPPCSLWVSLPCKSILGYTGALHCSQEGGILVYSLLPDNELTFLAASISTVLGFSEAHTLASQKLTPSFDLPVGLACGSKEGCVTENSVLQFCLASLGAVSSF